MANQGQEKVKGVVDIVFLMDATGSMGNCIDKLKENVMLFFRSLTETDPTTQNFPPVKDWRAKVVGFRDVEADGASWFEDNAFTRDIGEIERQLAALKAAGGGDAPESLLDAICKVVDIPKAEKGVESADAWRNRSECARAVIAFTDAPYKPVMSAPGLTGGGLLDVRNRCLSERILLTVVSPKGIDDEGFANLEAIRYAKWLGVYRGSSGHSPIDEFMNNRNDLQNVIVNIAKTITKTATEQL